MIKGSPENWFNDVNQFLNPERTQTKENVYIPLKKDSSVDKGKAAKTIFPTDKKSN